MAKTIANLTNDEMMIITDYVELFGITEEEALSQAISEGSISDSVGGTFKYKPEGFNELKFYKVDPKSAMYKLNKELKKNKKDELFEDETFYYNTMIAKTEDKKGFDLDKCSTVKVGERPTIIVNKVAYKLVRNIFDSQNKPLSTNFETTLADGIYPSHQEVMFNVKGGESALSINTKLKKQYPDGEQGKTQAKVPAELKTKFRVVLYGLVLIEDKWEKFYMELSAKYDEKENLVAIFNKEATGMKSAWINELQITGNDVRENPIIQIQPIRKMEGTEITELKDIVFGTTREIAKFIQDQVAYAKGSKTTEDKAPANNSAEADNSEDPFSDTEE